MKELTQKVGTLGPQGCHPEGRSSAGTSETLSVSDKAKWMSYLPSKSTGGTFCLVLQAPWDKAQKLELDVIFYLGLFIPGL